MRPHTLWGGSVFYENGKYFHEQITQAIHKRFPNLNVIEHRKHSILALVNLVDTVDINELLGDGAPIVNELPQPEQETLNLVAHLFWCLKRFEMAHSDLEEEYEPNNSFSWFLYRDKLRELEVKLVSDFLSGRFDDFLMGISELFVHYQGTYEKITRFYGHDRDYSNLISSIYENKFEVPDQGGELHDFDGEIGHWVSNILFTTLMIKNARALGVEFRSFNPRFEFEYRDNINFFMKDFSEEFGISVKKSKALDLKAEMLGYESGYQQFKKTLIEIGKINEFGFSVDPLFIEASARIHDDITKMGELDLYCLSDMHRTWLGIHNDIQSQDSIHRLSDDYVSDIIGFAGECYKDWFAEKFMPEKSQNFRIISNMAGVDMESLFDGIAEIAVRLICSYDVK